MKINPAMLALSAANPGLLPLAFQPSPYSGRTPILQGGRTQVDVEHSFKKGSGDEFRSIQVDAVRAVNAYDAAITVLEGLLQEFSAAEDAQLRKQMEADKIKMAQRKAEQEKLDARKQQIEDEIAELQNRGRKFFSQEYRYHEDIEELYNQLFRIDFSSTQFDCDLFTSMMRGDWSAIGRVRSTLASIKDKRRMCAVATGTIEMCSADAKEIGAIEDGSFEKKHRAGCERQYKEQSCEK